MVSDDILTSLFNNDYLIEYAFTSYSPSTYITYIQSFISNTDATTYFQTIKSNGSHSIYIANDEDDQADQVTSIIYYYQEYYFTTYKVRDNNGNQNNDNNWYNNGILYTNYYGYIQYNTYISFKQNGTLQYMDVSCGDMPIIRHVLYTDGFIKKVETYDLLNKQSHKDDFSGCNLAPKWRYTEIIKNQAYDYQFLPFDFKFTTSEVIKTPQPYIVNLI